MESSDPILPLVVQSEVSGLTDRTPLQLLDYILSSP